MATVSFRRASSPGGRNMASLMTHMERNPGWADAVRYNQLTHVIEACAPWPPVLGSTRTWEPINEEWHVLSATRYFQENGHDRVGKQVVWDALILRAQGNAYHPVRDWLDSLAWDGTPRLHELCVRYFGAQLMPATSIPSHAHDVERQRQKNYLACAGRYTLIGAVARAYQPGCKMDTILVLVGEKQGERKSQAIAALSPDPCWVTDNIAASLMNKDSKEALRGKWIVELAEMHHHKTDAAAMKSFLSTPVDHYRPPYGRVTADWPRQCIMIGTANDLVLTDVTGNRRFWPFKVGHLDVERVHRDRSQLWAEAVSAFKSGSQWWPTQPEEALFVREQTNFEHFDTWQSVIYQWANQQPNFTITQLFDACRSDLTNGYGPKEGDEERAGKCLRRLGYFKVRKRVDGDRAYIWAKAQAGHVGQGGTP